MLAKILLILSIIIAAVFAIRDKKGEGFKVISSYFICTFLGLLVIIAMIYVAVWAVVTSTCVEYIDETRIDYNIYGLQFDDRIEPYSKGTFILGCGGFSSGSKTTNTYYFFSENEYGKKLEALDNSKIDVYIKETDDEQPSAKTIYRKQYLDGAWKWLFGDYSLEIEVGKILVVPTNTIKINYNVEVK